MAYEQNLVCFNTFGSDESWSLATYEKHGGYEAWRKILKGELTQWLEEHEYHSLRQMQGSMNLEACPDPAVYERANYMLMLQSWRTSH